MELTTLKVLGGDAIRMLNEYRARYPDTGLYPFLIGDAEEMGWIKEAAEFNKQEPAAIIRASFEVKTAEWIAGRRKEAEEYDFSPDELYGEWPGEVAEKGSIGLHKDALSGKIKPEVYLGLVKIETPWQLPAFLKYGAWNECPEPEVHFKPVPTQRAAETRTVSPPVATQEESRTAMSTPHHTRLPAALLIGLPLLSNAASFVVFAPLFAPGRTPADADVRLRSGAHQPVLRAVSRRVQPACGDCNVDSRIGAGMDVSVHE